MKNDKTQKINLNDTNSANDYKNINWADFKNRIIKDIYINTKLVDTGYIGNIKLEDVHRALENPKYEWRILLAASEQLMRVSPHYYRLNNLYANMALFDWGIDLCNVKDNANIDNIKNSYLNLANKLENMNLKHEFSKIMKVLPYKDIYCGVIAENQNDFFIQQIDFNICKLYQIQDGLFNFAINLKMIKSQNIQAYPLYIREEWLKCIDGEEETWWYIPPADKQICIKLNSQWNYPFPMLIGLLRDILDLDIYKKLKLQSARTDNYKAIMVEVPIDKNAVDKPLLTPETLTMFADINKASMTDDIGLIHTLGSSGEAISFKDSSNTRNNVSDAVNNLYDASGITKELYNGSASGTAVTFSIENDAGFVYGVYRQFERWINRYIKLKKYNKSTYKFSFYLLDITIFNKDNVSKRYKDACALGANLVDKWLASLEMTPSKILGSYIIHKNIFDFQNNFIALSSTYNSSSNEAGRPTNASKGETLDISGEVTENADSNIDR